MTCFDSKMIFLDLFRPISTQKLAHRGVWIRGHAQKGAWCAKGGISPFWRFFSTKPPNEVFHVQSLRRAISGSFHTMFWVGFRWIYGNIYIEIQPYFWTRKRGHNFGFSTSKNHNKSAGNRLRTSYKSSPNSSDWVLEDGLLRLVVSLKKPSKKS